MKNNNQYNIATIKQIHRISTGLRIEKKLLNHAKLSGIEANIIIRELCNLNPDEPNRDFWDLRKSVENLSLKRITVN